MRRIFLSLLCTCFISASAFAADLLVDQLWSEDFETGTISGWESYPAFEDTAYDFTILPGHKYDRYTLQGYVGSGEFFYPVDLAGPVGTTTNTTYLLRSYRPNSASAQPVGATVKLRATVASDSVITFDYWLKNISEPTGISVQIGCNDGKRYSYQLPSFVTGQWQSVAVPVSAMRSGTTAPASGRKIQQLAIVPHFNKGDASSYIYFCLDNVHVTGKTQAGFDVTTPPTRSFKHWPMLFANKHYHPGETVSITARPNATLTSATARLVNFDGAVIRGPVAMSQSSGQFSGSLAFTTGDMPGPYMLVLEGADSTGKRARSDVRVWLLKNVPAGTHPRLWFSSADIPRLQARRTSGDGAAGWSYITGRANQSGVQPNSLNQYFPKDYLVPDQTHYNTWTSALTGPELSIFYTAFVYAIAGDTSYGIYSANSLVTMAGWDQWNHPWFQGQGRYCYYMVGRVAQSLGFSYDATYGLLSSTQRDSARRGLMKNGVIPAWTEWFRDDRVGNNTSNWIHHACGGPVQALIAMEGELTGDDAANWDIYFSGPMEKVMALPKYTLHEDGAWGEDFSYQDYAQQGGQPVFAALKQAYGVADLVRSLNYLKGHTYPLYASFNNSTTMLPMGDSHATRIASSWVWFAQESNDPVYRWFVNQASTSRWEGFLWADSTMPMTSPGAAGWPKSKAFPQKGNVVFRSGWGTNDIVLLYRGGPNYNHTHVDQGNFIMSVGNEQIVSEAGCYSYYYQDPYFWSYFCQSVGHNVVLVDGNPESQQCGDFLGDATAFNTRAKTDRVCLAGPVNFLSSQLEPVYRGVLFENTRRIYFLDPGVAVVFDRLVAPTTHKYIWQLFPVNKNALSIIGPYQAVFNGSSNAVQIHAVGAESWVQLGVQDKPIAAPQLMTTSPKKRAALQLANTIENTLQDYCVALVPVRGGSALASAVTEVTGTGYRGARLTMADREATVVFAKYGNQIQGDTATDGPSACVVTSSGQLIGAAYELATRGNALGKALFTSTEALNAGLDRTGTYEKWTFNAPKAATVTVTMANNQQTILTVPAGDSVFTLDHSSSAGPSTLKLR